MGTCSAPLYNLLSCTTLLLLKKEKRSSARKRSGDVRSESKESQGVELRPVFQIENYVLHFTRVPGAYHQKIAVMRASHIYVV